MFSCFNENASARSWDISCEERDAGSEAKSRRRAEMRKGWLGGNCLDLGFLVRSLSLPLAKIKVIVLTTLVYDNTRRQFSKRIIFRSFHEASAQHEKQHEFTLQNSWLFLPGDYPLTTDTEVKKLDFYAISASKARVLILIGWESGEKILNQSQIRKVQNQIFNKNCSKIVIFIKFFITIQVFVTKEGGNKHWFFRDLLTYN